jgi:predicted DsbA family dithiol-disulfide isomerase
MAPANVTLTQAVEIEIFSDVVCPWCWIGERKLRAALETFDGEVTLRWRAYQLDPSATSDGTPLVDWLGRRYGGRANAERMFENVTSVAAQVGLEMKFDRAISANTRDAHRVIWLASAFGKQVEMVESLHEAHFTDGLDIGDHEVLVSRAVAVGLPEESVRGAISRGERSEASGVEALLSDESAAAVDADIERARDFGITGVPTFVFAGKYAISGAQDPATIREVLEEVRRRESTSPITLLTPGGGEVCTDERC